MQIRSCLMGDGQVIAIGRSDSFKGVVLSLMRIDSSHTTSFNARRRTKSKLYIATYVIKTRAISVLPLFIPCLPPRGRFQVRLIKDPFNMSACLVNVVHEAMNVHQTLRASSLALPLNTLLHVLTHYYTTSNNLCWGQ